MGQTAALRLTEVVIEGRERIREMQIEAAADAHADAVAICSAAHRRIRAGIG